MAIVCVIIANLFLIDRNALIAHYNKLPNLRIYYANFPNLKGLRAPSRNFKKKNPEW